MGMPTMRGGKCVVCNKLFMIYECKHCGELSRYHCPLHHSHSTRTYEPLRILGEQLSVGVAKQGGADVQYHGFRVDPY